MRARKMIDGVLSATLLGTLWMITSEAPVHAMTGWPSEKAHVGSIAALDPTQVPGQSGLLWSGSHTVRARIPASTPVVDYQNAGYSIEVVPNMSATKKAELLVDVSVHLDAARSLAPYVPGQRSESSRQLGKGLGAKGIPPEISRLAQTLVHGVQTYDAAVTAILSWTARNIEYRLDRSQAQDAVSVLERRTSYCTGSAALAVALLEAAGIGAREVVGYSLEPRGGQPAGYHRWVEVYYPDIGWRFSDPKASVGFVPATYIRLAGEWVPTANPHHWAVQSEVDTRRPVTSLGSLPAGFDGRYQGEPVVGASLRVNVPLQAGGGNLEQGSNMEIELAGPRWIRRRYVRRGSVDFVDLAPGTYRVKILESGRRIRPDRKIVVSGTGRFDL